MPTPTVTMDLEDYKDLELRIDVLEDRESQMRELIRKHLSYAIIKSPISQSRELVTCIRDTKTFEKGLYSLYSSVFNQESDL